MPKIAGNPIPVNNEINRKGVIKYEKRGKKFVNRRKNVKSF